MLLQPSMYSSPQGRLMAGSWAAAVLVLHAAGCQLVPDFSADRSPPAMVAGGAPAEASEPSSAGTATVVPVAAVAEDQPPATEVDPATAAELRMLLEQTAWHVDLAWSVLSADQPGPTRPWRYAFLPKLPADASHPPVFDGRALFEGTPDGVDEITRQGLDALLASWSSGHDAIAMNAVILRARWEAQRNVVVDDDTLSRLQTLAEGRTPPVPSLATRSAAAEAWCRCLRLLPGDWEQSLLPAGLLLERAGLPDELRGTLWRSLAESVPPDRLPGLSRTLSDRRNSGLRRAALEACVLYASRHPGLTSTHRDWPEILPTLRLDADPVIRQLFARWAALGRPEEAVPWIRELARDVDPGVQEQAIRGLGWTRSSAGRELLRELRRSDAERLRAVAAMASASWGIEELHELRQDSGPSVRTAVAKALAKFPEAEAQRWLRDYLADESLEVQAAAVSAVADWPAELAVPVLLDALCGSALRTRQLAHDLLRSRFCPGVNFPVDASLAEREEAVRRWAAERGWKWQAAVYSPTAGESSADDRTLPEELAVIVQAYVDAVEKAPTATERWAALLEPADVPTIERFLADQSPVVMRTVVAELLPRLSPLYGLLPELESRDVLRRRQAANQLAELAAAHPLSPLFLEQLHERLALEQDRLVWQACMTAVQRESHPAAVRIALLALHSNWPDVRELGVQFVADHPQPDAALWLLPLLHDPYRSVRLAAIAAAGRCQNAMVLEGLAATEKTPARPGLRSLLTDHDPEIQWAALSAMVCLRDEAAAGELLRRTFDPQPAVRERAVAALGASGQPRFVEPLIKLAWTEPAVSVKRAILRSLDDLVPPERQPALPTGLAALPSIDDKIRIWTTWWSTAARPPSASSPALGSDEQVYRETPTPR
uniref:HEAT repeat domain-containing protein n=1 Tax=Schlesneria paludicola TaxID=360056 RepID=A0A7C4QRF9_9PLAN